MIELISGAASIIDRLNQCGHSAYIVGGCVRDSLMGRIPKDWDICTSAKPEEVLSVFRDHRVIETGLKHGTVTIMIGDEAFEVTTYRIDGVYTDNRRPETVSFVDNIELDLARRDFTVNAMAFNANGLIDKFGGYTDIKEKIIRCVGDAEERFQEDALRILRALRFSAVYGFVIEDNTALAMRKHKHLLHMVSKERVNAELNKMLLSDNIREILIEYVDILGVVIPELLEIEGFIQNNPFHDFTVLEHTARVVENTPKVLELRLAAFLHDIAKPRCYTEENGRGHFYGHEYVGEIMSLEILQRLKYSNDIVNTVSQLIGMHKIEFAVSAKHVRKMLNKYSEAQYRNLIHLRRADIIGQSMKDRRLRLLKVDSVLAILDRVIEEEQCFSLKDLAIKGRDILELGAEEGKIIGDILNNILNLVIEGQIENNREDLIKFASKLLMGD